MSLTDIPLQFSEFQHLNHIDKCSKFTEILQNFDVIQINDLDSLYTDLEVLQGASNKRLRRLEDEVKILTEWCDKKERNKIDEIDLNVPTTSKRSRTGGSDDNKLSKKQKLDEPTKNTASKLRSKGKVTSSDTNENDSYVPTNKPRTSYDAPNKFWNHVEPYCTDITQDDIKLLEDSLTSRVDINEYYKIPPLGKHYSEIWAKEDLIEQQQQNNKIDKKRGNNTTPLTNVENVESKILNIENIKHQNEDQELCPYGNFTQRLVAALVDENIMAPTTENELQDIIQVNNEIKLDTKSQSNNNNINKKTVTNYSKNLETAIKDELFSLGLIDSVIDDEHDFDADDEVLSELKKCQSELKALRSHNKQSINKLVAKAKVTMKKQEAKLKAKVLDGEVVEIFRRFSSSKAKKKGFTRKDREIAWKAIREREQLWKLVDSSNENSDKIEKTD